MGKKRKSVKPQYGDLIEVHWVDITSSSTGDPSKAVLARCITCGVFERYDKDKNGEEMLVISYARHDDEELTDKGWEAYPRSVVRRVEVVKRASEYV